MYDVALSVLSCLRAGTDVHVAWLVDDLDAVDEALAITPGGGRLGELMAGALDHAIVEAATDGAGGRLVEVTLGPVESLISGKPEGFVVTVAIVSGETLPVGIWEDIAARLPVRFELRIDGDRLADPHRLDSGEAGTTRSGDRLVTSLVPVPRMVISGGGPIAGALVDAFSLLAWRASAATDFASAEGLMAMLSPIDGVVVMGHDVEGSSRALQAAIASSAGYIGSLGSAKMQQQRREWLAYRDVAWDERIHGPAGLPIGAGTPGEIAVSIAAEAISVLRGPRTTHRD